MVSWTDMVFFIFEGDGFRCHIPNWLDRLMLVLNGFLLTLERWLKSFGRILERQWLLVVKLSALGESKFLIGDWKLVNILTVESLRHSLAIIVNTFDDVIVYELMVLFVAGLNLLESAI